MSDNILTWWVEQIASLAPARLRGRDPAAADCVLATPLAPSGMFLAVRRRGRIRELGRFDLAAPGARDAVRAALPPRARPAAVVLLAPAMLQREVTLPLAAERDPGQVLRYELDRITPFSAEEVFWSYDITRRDRARGRLHLMLSLAPRAPLQPLLGALSMAGLAPTALGGADGRRIELLRSARTGRLARRVNVALAGLCVAMAIVAAAMPFVAQSRDAALIEARIAALRPLVNEADALRRRIAANESALDVVAAERAKRGDALAVLAAVTDLLPDGTSLTDLTLNEGRLVLDGQSDAAVRLIGALSADATIHNPGFAAPVTRFDNKADLFSIRAEVGR